MEIIFYSKTIKDLGEFKQVSGIANRLADALREAQEKVFTRDLFGNG